MIVTSTSLSAVAAGLDDRCAEAVLRDRRRHRSRGAARRSDEAAYGPSYQLSGEIIAVRVERVEQLVHRSWSRKWAHAATSSEISAFASAIGTPPPATRCFNASGRSSSDGTRRAGWRSVPDSRRSRRVRLEQDEVRVLADLDGAELRGAAQERGAVERRHLEHAELHAGRRRELVELLVQTEPAIVQPAPTASLPASSFTPSESSSFTSSRSRAYSLRSVSFCSGEKASSNSCVTATWRASRPAHSAGSGRARTRALAKRCVRSRIRSRDTASPSPRARVPRSGGARRPGSPKHPLETVHLGRRDADGQFTGGVEGSGRLALRGTAAGPASP